MVLNHQLTPSCTSSKLVELLASGIVLFLNHSLHTSSGSRVMMVATSLVFLESICSGLGVGLVAEGETPPEATLVPPELGVRRNEVG